MTAARMTANRANAQHSTGPQDTSRTRFNGMQHGLTSKQTVLPGESQEEYDSFRQEFLNDFDPQSAMERTLADRAIAAAWRLKRFQGVENAFYTDRIDAYLKDNPKAGPDAAMANLFIDPVESKKMSLFLRYQTNVQREYDKAVNEFRKARAEREQQQFEQAMVAGARQRAATSSGFASHPSPTPDTPRPPACFSRRLFNPRPFNLKRYGGAPPENRSNAGRLRGETSFGHYRSCRVFCAPRCFCPAPRFVLPPGFRNCLVSSRRRQPVFMRPMAHSRCRRERGRRAL